ncbi:hypothetical protein D3C80_1428550 [compost metagenome]
MTVLVIDRLEVVHIHRDQRQRLTKTPRTATSLLQRFFQQVAIGDQGQGITLGKITIFIQLALQLLIDPGQFPRAISHHRFQ